MLNIADCIYYVYLYLDENGQPYYVGKGKNRRISAKHSNTVVPPKERRIKVAVKLTQFEAFTLEHRLIRQYGRKIDGGILDNIRISRWTRHKGWNHKTETKITIGDKNRGLKRTEEQLKNYKGTTSKEVAAKISITLTGHEVATTTRKKIADALTGNVLSEKTIAKRTVSFNETIAKRKEAESLDPSLAKDRKEKKSKAASGANNGHYGKKLSAETIAKRTASFNETITKRKALKEEMNG